MKKKNEIPELTADALKQGLWEAFNLAKDKKLHPDFIRGMALSTDSILKIVKVEMAAAKQHKELGTGEKILIGREKS